MLASTIETFAVAVTALGVFIAGVAAWMSHRAGQRKDNLDTADAVSKARDRRAEAQITADGVTAITTDSTTNVWKFGTKSKWDYAYVLVNNSADVEFHDLIVTFDSDPGSPKRHALLKPGEDFEAYPGDTKPPVGSDLGRWTLTYLDPLNRRWKRTSDDQQGWAIKDVPAT